MNPVQLIVGSSLALASAIVMADAVKQSCEHLVEHPHKAGIIKVFISCILMILIFYIIILLPSETFTSWGPHYTKPTVYTQYPTMV